MSFCRIGLNFVSGGCVGRGELGASTDMLCLNSGFTVTGLTPPILVRELACSNNSLTVNDVPILPALGEFNSPFLIFELLGTTPFFPGPTF